MEKAIRIDGQAQIQAEAGVLASTRIAKNKELSNGITRPGQRFTHHISKKQNSTVNIPLTDFLSKALLDFQ